MGVKLHQHSIHSTTYVYVCIHKERSYMYNFRPMQGHNNNWENFYITNLSIRHFTALLFGRVHCAPLLTDFHTFSIRIMLWSIFL